MATLFVRGKYREFTRTPDGNWLLIHQSDREELGEYEPKPLDYWTPKTPRDRRVYTIYS